MKTINAIDSEICALQDTCNKEQWDALTAVGQAELHGKARMLKNEREFLKKLPAEVQDVQDSLIDITEVIDNVDMTKAASIVKTLLRNGITKWELHAATAEILRSRHIFTGAVEYFKAITRIKINMQGNNCNIFDDKALDF